MTSEKKVVTTDANGKVVLKCTGTYDVWISFYPGSKGISPETVAITAIAELQHVIKGVGGVINGMEVNLQSHAVQVGFTRPTLDAVTCPPGQADAIKQEWDRQITRFHP